MTERDRLAAMVKAAGLRLGAGDLDLLLPAWKRYQSLVEELRATMAAAAEDDTG